MPRSLSTDTESRLWSCAIRFISTTGRPARAASASSGSLRCAVASTIPSTWRARICWNTSRSRSPSPSVLPISATYPAAASRSSSARTIGGNSGLVRSGMSTPTVLERRVRRLRATGLGW